MNVPYSPLNERGNENGRTRQAHRDRDVIDGCTELFQNASRGPNARIDSRIGIGPTKPLLHDAVRKPETVLSGARVWSAPTAWTASPQYFIDLPGTRLESDTLFALCQLAAKQ